jgi:ElaB/YqjD/DUF883 family membrane-anchored ribosome-binding protein
MTVEQLELKAEQDRAAVAGTLEELNKRLTPGELVDQVLGYIKGGGGEFLNNLGKQVTDNPMPVTLMGAGLAWFLFAKNAGVNGNGAMPSRGMYYPGSGPSNAKGAAEYAKDAASGIGDTASSAVHKVGDMASSAADGVGDAVGDAIGAAKDAANSAADSAASAYRNAADTLSMAKDTAMQAEQTAMTAARNAVAFCQDQPLILVGVGLALGAAIGAALPGTKFEDKLLGETADEMKEAAKDMAVTQLDQAKELGGKIGEALKDNSDGMLSTNYGTSQGTGLGAGIH